MPNYPEPTYAVQENMNQLDAVIPKWNLSQIQMPQMKARPNAAAPVHSSLSHNLQFAGLQMQTERAP